MYKAKVLKNKQQRDKNGHIWKVNPPTNFGVVDQNDIVVAYIPNHKGLGMANMISKLLNENRKYKLKDE